MQTPFGSLFVPNITPDPETGIGNWTEAQIVTALRDGKRPDGTLIRPPMPIFRVAERATAPPAWPAGSAPGGEPLTRHPDRPQPRRRSGETARPSRRPSARPNV